MDKINELLTRAVDKIYPSKEDLEKVLRSGKKLRVYQGFDPTGIQLHIGHIIGLRKLRQWQDLGHEVIFLIGSGTGQAGDPSGKVRAREKYLTEEELKKNAKDYVSQAGKILRFTGENPIKILFNGDWLNKLSLPELLDIASHFTLQQLAERDLFVERAKKGEQVNIREFFYPLLQAYDSVAMSVDLELGATDQTFNMLAGRDLVKAMQNREKFVMVTPLLTDSEGKKIGKTEGNVIALNDKPEDLFAKIMALGDDILSKGFEYLTSLPMEEVKEINNRLNSGENPMTIKKLLAETIVEEIHGPGPSKEAEEYFEETVQQKKIPQEVQEVKISDPNVPIIDILVETNLALSKSDAKRLIEQGGVEINNKRIDLSSLIEIKDGTLIKVGKRKFLRIKISP